MWVILLVTIVINEGGGVIDSISVKVLHFNKFAYFPKMRDTRPLPACFIFHENPSDSRSQCQECSQAPLGFVVPRSNSAPKQSRVQHSNPPPPTAPALKQAGYCQQLQIR